MKLICDILDKVFVWWAPYIFGILLFGLSSGIGYDFAQARNLHGFAISSIVVFGLLAVITTVLFGFTALDRFKR